ncbi:MAG: peptide chain release factor N(5)-glutamine methyltransferase [Eubacterium sp.]|nr:peptide chain release factor N(5)-glutamine methyltransferase [Eubacterium sp.]
MTLSEAFNYGVYFLSSNGIDEAEFKSLCLACHLAGIKNSEYPLHKNDEIIMKRFADLLWRVKSGEPLQYVIGKWDFYESEFYVGKGVLIPRPETEELTELVINKARSLTAPLIYDLCAGSGCIGISIAKAVPTATVYCIEKSADAMFYLLKNAEGVENVKVINGDVFFPPELPKADIIVSNPPYIKTGEIAELQAEVLKEPEMALDGGEDGLDFYRAICNKWKNLLSPNGSLFFEIGEDQGGDVSFILADNGYIHIEITKDMYGRDRIAKANN